MTHYAQQGSVRMSHDCDQHAVDSRLNVFVRIRPLSGEEKNEGLSAVWKKDHNVSPATQTSSWLLCTNSLISNSTNVVGEKTNDVSRYLFDDVLEGERCDNVEVYSRVVQPLLQHVLGGISACVLVYGQTSSGKTHTIRGSSKSSLRKFADCKTNSWHKRPQVSVKGNQDGLVQLTCRELFHRIRSRFGASAQDEGQYVKISYVEVYNEVCRDLLTKETGNVSLMDSKHDGVKLNATTIEVHTVEDVLECIKYGEQRRKVGVTVMNDKSSRSHTVLTLLVANFDHPEDCDNTFRYASLSFVDLAGSEGVRSTGSVTGQAREESRHINKSLLALSIVISRLAQHQNNQQTNQHGTPAKPRPASSLSTRSSSSSGVHVGFRDSKITRLLKPYLNGNAMVSVIACLNPTSKHHEESRNTVQFALAARKVRVEPTPGIGSIQLGDEDVIYQAPEPLQQSDTETEIERLRCIVERQQALLEVIGKGSTSVNEPKSEIQDENWKHKVLELENQLNQSNQNTQEALEHCAYLLQENSRLNMALGEVSNALQQIRMEEKKQQKSLGIDSESIVSPDQWEQLKEKVRNRDIEMMETVAMFEQRQSLINIKMKRMEDQMNELKAENTSLRSQIARS